MEERDRTVNFLVASKGGDTLYWLESDGYVVNCPVDVKRRVYTASRINEYRPRLVYSDSEPGSVDSNLVSFALDEKSGDLILVTKGKVVRLHPSKGSSTR
ncbi:MAG: hypothetical protein IIC73_02625 [Armatimonadetes bacterium]|nr:hypothetical protein [Armatimonadota bacterium]